jgi:hypothetical protein
MSTLAEQLAALGMRGVAVGLDDLVAMATKKRWSHTQLLEEVVRMELSDRARRSLDRVLPQLERDSLKAG